MKFIAVSLLPILLYFYLLCFCQFQEVCFEHLYHLVEKLQWRKGFLAWQKVFGELSSDPLANVRPLDLKFQAS